MDGVTWEQFVKDINVIYEISKELKDGWELIHVVSTKTNYMLVINKR